MRINLQRFFNGPRGDVFWGVCTLVFILLGEPLHERGELSMTIAVVLVILSGVVITNGLNKMMIEAAKRKDDE